MYTSKNIGTIELYIGTNISEQKQLQNNISDIRIFDWVGIEIGSDHEWTCISQKFTYSMCWLFLESAQFIFVHM